MMKHLASARAVFHAAADARAATAIWLPLTLLVSATVVLGVSSRAPRAIDAKVSTSPDSDSDGLDDALEDILGTSPDVADSDGDSFGDLEEVARQSSPVLNSSTPLDTPVSCGVAAEMSAGSLNLHNLIYVQGMGFIGVALEIGIVLDGVKIPVNPAVYVGVSAISFHPSQNGLGTILHLRTPIPSSLIQQIGTFSFYNTVADNRTFPSSTAASVLNLVDFSGTTMSLEPAPSYIQGGSGVIYRPLVDDGSIPPSWTTGQICWQETTPAGVIGVSVIHEVESANCESMDTYCAPANCAASVGGTITLVDPGALVGG